jgi:hypothetical protein
MFYFCLPLELLRAKGCQNVPTPVHVFLLANKNISRKSIHCKNIQQLPKETTLLKLQQKSTTGQALVTHACNPSYLGGRDQEDQDSRLAWATKARAYLENTQKECW